MHRLRTPRQLARLLLACFAMALAVAVATPLVQARPMERVCTASGEERWVAAGGKDAGTVPGAAHLLDCALCLPPMLPASAPGTLPSPQGRPAMAAAPLARMEHVPALSRAPFPPRAPPAPGTPL
ncbi:MAG TPA: DUF2946 family protein [Alicycliphilus sp.]|nr:DUF2946 family protein [Alicycliphilus sp.]